jgi:hypothetical protein
VKTFCLQQENSRYLKILPQKGIKLNLKLPNGPDYIYIVKLKIPDILELRTFLCEIGKFGQLFRTNLLVFNKLPTCLAEFF